ncbi:GAF domain-containing protein [Pseudomonas sp. 681]|uniref:GAF domain-containing protein n=1 Tax=Pseudomonas fungipugnans TaxID=3024217 RepID=A0ABT6QI77_9PSED|nr:GAF domain-containing protein [Pseudomonas sp. 681]MDI2589979.1 GAF domain-containing protein [Pseudomonas sp. 681]
MDLKQVNQANKNIEYSIVSASIFCANTWMTLIAPLVIGLFASKLFASQDFTPTEITLYSISITIHIIFAVIIFYAGNRRSTTLAVEESLTETEKYKSEIIPKAKAVYEVSKTQQSVTYLMTLELESLIDEVRSRPVDYPLAQGLKDWEAGLNRILWHLVDHRTQLFGYKGDSLYNFALYMYDETSEELCIKWRSHDNRLNTSNRRWKPGFGHVGLAFIQGEAKICQDIAISSELSDSATIESDKKNYRSFISVPIKDSYNILGGNKPLGVLVFTSNHVSQFSWERDKIFTLTVAKILSMYIERHMISLVEGTKNEREGK